MFQIIGITIAVAAAGAVAFVAAKPNTFQVQRETTIKAPAEKIFALINDLHLWTTWSPYEKKDPAMKRTYSGSESGKGAIYEWNGNDNVGQGRMEILDTTPPSKVTIKLDFIKPFEGHNTAEFRIEPNGDDTKVTWVMFGNSNFMTKVMHCFFDMDKMIGTDFAVGLANLKAATEQAS